MSYTVEAPLNPLERETVINFSDGEPVARIATHQRRIITKLEKNPLAVKVEDLQHGSQPGGVWEIPARFITIRSTDMRGRTAPASAFRKRDSTVAKSG